MSSRGVRTLTGDPRKAIIRLSIPMVIAMASQTLYNLADAVWVSGLGSGALGAVGFFFPFMMLALSVSMGIGIGGGSAVSRFIGAGERDNADAAATHTVVLTLVAAGIYTILSIVFLRPVFLLLGAGEVLSETADYARIMFGGSVFLFFMHSGGALLRGEGDADRAGRAILIGSLLNILLDPVFIYKIPVSFSGLNFSLGFGYGVAGAAWATVISMGAASLMMARWMFFKQLTYVRFSFRRFAFRWDIVKNIISVGLPSSIAHASMSIMMFLITKIVAVIGGADGVAVYTTGWRVVMVAVLPLQGMATAVTSVTGAAYGGRAYGKLKRAYFFAVKTGLGVETLIAFATFAAAPVIAGVFTWSEGTIHLRGDIVTLLRIVSFFYPAIAFGMLSSAMFQGIGKGLYSLIITLLRTLILGVPLAAFFGLRLGMGLPGVYLGIVTGTWTATLGAFLWASLFINRIQKAPET